MFLVTFYPSLKPLWSPCQLLQASWNKNIKNYIVVNAFSLQFNATASFSFIFNFFYTELTHCPAVHLVREFTLLYSVHSTQYLCICSAVHLVWGIYFAVQCTQYLCFCTAVHRFDALWFYLQLTYLLLSCLFLFSAQYLSLIVKKEETFRL